jgi:hypothetical protein
LLGFTTVNSAANPPQSSPVLYVAGSNVLATVTFTNHTRSVSDVGGIFPMLIKGEVSGGHTSFTLWGTNTAAVSANCVVETHADQPLTTNMVDVFQPMTVNWYYAYINHTNWLYAGTSTNTVYVSWQPPTTGNLYHTVVDVACRNAIGQTTESNIVAGIWSDFAGPIPGVYNFKNTTNGEMKYWPDGFSTPAYFYTSNLVAHVKGRCGAWRHFFRDTLLVHAIQSSLLVIEPDIDGIIVPPTNFPNIAFKTFTTSVSNPGQGNSGPPLTYQDTGSGIPIDWGDHHVTFYQAESNSIIFDPSYGVMYSSTTGLSNAQSAWTQSSVIGFAVYFTNSTGSRYRAFATYAAVQNAKTNGNVLKWTQHNE